MYIGKKTILGGPSNPGGFQQPKPKPRTSFRDVGDGRGPPGSPQPSVDGSVDAPEIIDFPQNTNDDIDDEPPPVLCSFCKDPIKPGRYIFRKNFKRI